MPQELEVWYLLPSLRKEIVKVFVKDFNLTQKECANILGITESAISQYLKNKRAGELKFNKEEIKIIKHTAEKIVRNREKSHEYLYELSKKLRGTKSLCELHRKRDKHLLKNCRICMGE